MFSRAISRACIILCLLSINWYDHSAKVAALNRMHSFNPENIEFHTHQNHEFDIHVPQHEMNNIDLSSLSSGFWYGNTRPPQTHYETVPFVNLTVKVDYSYHDGPGAHLLTDPIDGNKSIYAGNTVNRQNFDTAFILDMSFAVGINPNRIYVIGVDQGRVHYSWESNNVIVDFLFMERNSTSEPTLLEALETLTSIIQNKTSKLYVGTNVTNKLDPLWGLEVKNWDV